jgi:long-chain acyl-CoA synthetase
MRAQVTPCPAVGGHPARRVLSLYECVALPAELPGPDFRCCRPQMLSEPAGRQLLLRKPRYPASVVSLHRPVGVFDVLEAPTRRSPGAQALVTCQGETTYESLDELADMASGALYDLGIRPGDRVAASLPNDLDIIVCFHAAMRLGAIWVGVNRALAPPEKAFILTDSQSSLLIADPAVADDLSDRLTPDLRLVDAESWAGAVDASRGRPPVPTPDPSAPAGIAYTSGTTGHPKGAVHSQAGLILPGQATVARRGWGADLRKGDSLPLTILNMMVLTTLLTAQAGGTAIIFDRGDVASVVEWIRRERVTEWNGPPAQLHTMVNDQSIQEEDLASLREVWVGGGDCPDRLRDAFEKRFGIRVSRTYGLTEAPALVCLDDLTGGRPEGTSGRPLDHVRVAALDDELVLSAVADGPWAGEYKPMLGYWNKPAESEAVLADGLLHTGDLGSLTASGHLRVMGRKSHMIIRGGANVYPAEVERVLAEAPGVQACAVVGVPDDRLGERVGAAIETLPGAPIDRQAILDYCGEQLAAYKIPERLVFVERLPRNQMGKVPHGEIRRLLSPRPGSDNGP